MHPQSIQHQVGVEKTRKKESRWHDPKVLGQNRGTIAYLYSVAVGGRGERTLFRAPLKMRRSAHPGGKRYG